LTDTRPQFTPRKAQFVAPRWPAAKPCSTLQPAPCQPQGGSL